jgi:very-short-patch-repair endonuclease
VHALGMTEVFIGSEALAEGQLSRHELRRWYRPLYRDVLVPKGSDPTLADRTTGAWLWSRRRAVVAGLAASAMHGAAWVEQDIPIELNWESLRFHPGLLVRNEGISPDEIISVSGIPVTTPTRTAFDIGRHQPAAMAVARLDALVRATGFSTADVLVLAQRYPGARGIRRLKAALPLVDAGSQSPKETWLRLLLRADGLPAPRTQIPVDDDGYIAAYLDMGWELYKVAVEYDGEQHRTDRRQYVKDIRRREMLEEFGWIVVRVVVGESEVSILRRVHAALRSRGYTEIDGKQGFTRTSAA